MDLYVVRHAIARQRSSPETADGEEAANEDSERPLTARGQRKMWGIARGLRRLGVRVSRIVSSPYRRAAETANILSDVLKSEVTLSDALVPDGDPEKLMEELSGLAGATDSVAIVGHEPYLGRLISMLVSGSPDLPFELKKGGCSKLVLVNPVYERCANLSWWMTPKHLRRFRNT